MFIKQVTVVSENAGPVGVESKGCSPGKCWVSFGLSLDMVALPLGSSKSWRRFFHKCLFSSAGSTVSFPLSAMLFTP